MDVDKLEGYATITIKVLVSLGVIGAWLYVMISGGTMVESLDTAAKLVLGAIFGTALSAGLRVFRTRHRE